EVQLRRQWGKSAIAANTKVAGFVVSGLILAIIIGINFDRKVREVQERAFGPHPAGIPNIVFVNVVSVILFAPFFWIIPHLMTIVRCAKEDGGSLGSVGLILYLAGAGRRRPELKT